MHHFRSVLLFSLLLFQSATSTTISVSKSGSHYTSVQAAVDHAFPGDTILITDTDIYEEQVTIDSTKPGITIRSADPASLIKPVIRWKDTRNNGPLTASEALISEKITYDKNGALRLIKAHHVTIDGVCLDGEEPWAFCNFGVWQGLYTLLHGNAAVCIYASGRVTIRNCELRNAFFGLYVKDCNNAGVYAVPASPLAATAFGLNGNHLFENNRIHSNSTGLFFESMWDLGSSVRFNLIYNNYHAETTLNALSTLNTSERELYPGGAFIFKNGYYSPLAIYNNSMWHNYSNFIDQNLGGGQHLLFNNIYGKPKYYWGTGYPSDPDYHTPWNAIDIAAFTNHSYNCIYSAQYVEPKPRVQMYYSPCKNKAVNVTGFNRVAIMNGMDKLEVEGEDYIVACPDGSTETISAEWVIQPGAKILDPFPSVANMRWLETDSLFQSTDPLSPHFLKPKWDDPKIITFVKNKGWPGEGILNTDETSADIGAVSSSGSVSILLQIRPTQIVRINETQALTSFVITSSHQNVSNLRIKMLNWIKKIPVQSSANSGGHILTISAEDIVPVDITGKSVQIGKNLISFTIPEMSEEAGFFEMIVEGVDPEGHKVNSDVGFLPYRKLTGSSENKRLVIYYGDTSGYDPGAWIRETIPARVPVTIRYLQGDSLLERNIPITFESSNGILAFSSASSTSPQTTFSLQNGVCSLWISSAAKVESGIISVTASDEGNAVTGQRGNIFFDAGTSKIRGNARYRKSGVQNYSLFDLRGRKLADVRSSEIRYLQKMYNFPSGAYIIQVKEKAVEKLKVISK